MEELEALVILNTIPRSSKIRLLINHYGSAKAMLEAPLSELESFHCLRPLLLNILAKECPWKKDLELVENLHAHVIPYTNPLYPKRLLEIADYPLVLYSQGMLTNKDQRCVAIVGTRQATHYGQEVAQQFSRELVRGGFTIVSGLARGIDTAAHHGALEEGRTLAVLGSGLCSLYPPENQRLAERIQQRGALLTEFPMSTPPNRYNFPLRNRIVSGISMGTILIEAPIKSGAMLTAEQALLQGRSLFAVPGRIDQENFKGNHALLKEGKALLIEKGEDVIKYFQDYPLSLPKNNHPMTSSPLDPEEKELIQQMPSQETSMEELFKHFSWSIAKLNITLQSLVLKKRIKEYPGKMYRKV